jgi:hypothetical protein
MHAEAHGLEPGLTEAVIGSAFEVANVLGSGFLEKVYERALIRELALRGVRAKAQVVALLINFQRPAVEWKRVLLDP